MSLKEIENRIIREAAEEASRIEAQAEAQAQGMEKSHRAKIEAMKAERQKAARQKAEEAKKSIVVPARLNAKKALLEEKQRILNEIYSGIQKENNLSDAELAKLREASEVTAAKVLYG
ncbi:hypothetical protein ACFL31_03030 [Candidatus Margulisiibacteriota bacterium]